MSDHAFLSSSHPLNTVAHAYNSASELVSISDAYSAYAFTRDKLGRAIKVDNNGTPGAPRAVLASTFDTAGNRLTVQVGGPDPIGGAALPGIVDFKNVYFVDAASRTTRIDQVQQTGATVAEKRVDLAYNVAGQFQTIVRRNSVAGSGNEVATSQYGFDQLGRGKSLAHTGPGSLSIAYAMSYDQLSRVIQFVGPDGTRDYGYDETNQLKTADYSGSSGVEETYNFDQSGNRTGTNNNGSGNKTYTAGTNNRLVRDGTYEYTYDAEGNRIRRVTLVGGNPTGATTDYDHDHRNRMFRVTQRATPGGTAVHIVEYVYDAFDRRIAKKIDATPDGFFEDEERFLYDGSDIIVSFNTTNAVEHRYLHGPAVDQVFADEQLLSGEGTLWGLADLQGTIRDLANNAAQIKNHLKYDSFGRTTEESAAGVDFLFGYTGRERDEEMGLMYYRSRYYDPVVGRFIEEDGAGFGAGDYNLARYIGNGPTNGTDPSGMFDEDLFWENVKLLAPDVEKWFSKEHGVVEQGGYTRNATAYWEDRYNTGTAIPVVYLEEDYNEFDAAVVFIEKVVNGWTLAPSFRTSKFCPKIDESAELRNYQDWWYDQAVDVYLAGLAACFGFVSIVNEGADWIITTEEVSNGNYLAILGYLPFISGGAFKFADKGGGVLAEVGSLEGRLLRDLGANSENLAAIRRLRSRGDDLARWLQSVLDDYWTYSSGAVTEAQARSLAAKHSFGFELGRVSRFENARNSVVISRTALRDGLINRIELAEEIQHGLDRATLERTSAVHRGLTNAEFHREVYERMLLNYESGAFDFLTLEDATGIRKAMDDLNFRR